MTMKKILGTLKVDLFGCSPRLTFNGKTVYKSWPGVIMTYIFFGLTVLTLINSGQELLLKQNPIVIINEIKHSTANPPKINMNSGDIKIAFAQSNSDNIETLDLTYFKIGGRQVVFRNKDKFGQFQIIQQNFDMIECTEDRKPKESDKVYPSSSEDLVTYCMGENFTSLISSLSFNKTEQERKGLYLNGFFGADEYSTIYIGISRCVNNTNDPKSPVCKPKEEIDKKLDKIIFGGFVLNKYLHLEDFDNPFRQTIEYFFTKVNNASTKVYQLFFQKGKIETDKGFLVKEQVSTEFFTLSSKKEYLQSSQIGDLPFLYFSFELDNVQKDYSRRYKKIPDLVAEVGGIVKILLLMLNLIMRPIVLNSYKKEFIKIFAKTDESDEARKLSKPNISTGKCKFCCNIKINQRRAEASCYEFVERKLDLRNVFLVIQQFERLSKIVFDKYQYLLFKRYCSNPFIEGRDCSVDPKANLTVATHLYYRAGEHSSLEEEKKYQNALIELKKRGTESFVIDRNLMLLYKQELNLLQNKRKASENIVSSEEFSGFPPAKHIPRECKPVFKKDIQLEFIRKTSM